MRVYAVVTAGGRVDPTLANAIETDIKALAPLGARRLIDAPIDAARAIGVDGIAVVGGDAVRAYCGDRVERFIEAADDGVTNISRALHAFPDFDRLVYLTSDLPFIDGPSLAAFVERSRTASLTMALASAASYEAEFPGAPPHFVQLGRERFANGSVFTLERAAREPLERVAGRFFRARKSLARLAMLLGPALCARYALGRLRLADIEARAQRILGVEARAVLDAAPGLCYDVDDVADWAYAHSLALARE